MTRPHAQSHNVLRQFCSRFTGSLRDWFESLGEYKQLQLIQTTIPISLAVIYEQFIREPAASTEASRKEYHQMKCSLKRHHLEMHCKRMSMLYYKLNGFNYPFLKHVFIASLPPELQRQLTAFNLDIANVSLEKIFQLTMLYPDKICEQKYFFKDLIEHKEPFASACKKPYLKIQCKDDKKCTYPTNKKKHFQKHFHKSSSKKPKKPYRYFRKKDPSQFKKRNTIAVLFAKSVDILPAIAQISQQKLFISFSTCSNLPYFLTTKMLNPSSQNNRRKMIIQSSFLPNQQIQNQMKFM